MQYIWDRSNKSSKAYNINFYWALVSYHSTLDGTIKSSQLLNCLWVVNVFFPSSSCGVFRYSSACKQQSCLTHDCEKNRLFYHLTHLIFILSSMLRWAFKYCQYLCYTKMPILTIPCPPMQPHQKGTYSIQCVCVFSWCKSTEKNWSGETSIIHRDQLDPFLTCQCSHTNVSNVNGMNIMVSSAS